MTKEFPNSNDRKARPPGCASDLEIGLWSFFGHWPLAIGHLSLLLLLSFGSISLRAAEPGPDDRHSKPIPIAKIKRSSPVDFDREILPILKDNCLACHNKTAAKSRLILETPQDILKGGDSGPAATPGKSASSLLLQAASHQLEDTLMPPPGNKVQASNLTPGQLGLVKLWIDQGARASTSVAKPIEWQPLPQGLHPIYAVAVSPDGQFAACARANQVFIYHLPTRQLAGQLSDPQLLKPGSRQPVGAAHRSIVQSLAFSPDGSLLASGAYREVKIWQRPSILKQRQFAVASRGEIQVMAASPDGQWLAFGDDTGRIRIWNTARSSPARPLTGHHGAIQALRFSDDNHRLASAAADHILRVWELPAGKTLAQARADSDVRALAWLESDTEIASGGTDQRIHIWRLNPASREIAPVRELAGHQGAVTALDTVHSPDLRVLSGSDDGSLRFWNPGTGESVRELKLGGPVAALAARRDGQRIAAAGPDNAARLWNASDGQEIARLKGDRHAQEFAADRNRALAFAKSEVEFQTAQLKSAETNQTAQLDRAKKAADANQAAEKTLAEKQKKRMEAFEAKTAAEKVVEETRVLARKAAEDQESADVAAKQAEAEMKALREPPGQDSPTTRKAAAESAAKVKTLLEARKQAEKAASETKQKEKEAGEKLKSAAKALEDTDTELKKAEQTGSNAATELQLAGKAVDAAAQAIVQCRDARQQAETLEKDAETEFATATQAVARSEQPIRSIAFSPDNRTLATAGDDGAVHLWSADDGAAIETLKANQAPVRGAAFAGRTVLASLGADRTLVLWNLQNDWKFARVVGTGDNRSPLVDRVNTLAFSPDGRTLATGGGEPTRAGEIKLWQTATGTLTQSFVNVHSDAVFGLAFSPDGKYLASGAADKFVKVIELASGKVVRQFEGHTHHVLGVSWNRNGRTLASAGADNTVKFWDFTQGEKKKTVTGFDKEVTAVQFVGYSDQALAVSGDTRVRLIREDGSDVRSFVGATEFLESAAITPDGKTVVAGGEDGVLRVWNGTDAKLLASFPPP